MYDYLYGKMVSKVYIVSVCRCTMYLQHHIYEQERMNECTPCFYASLGILWMDIATDPKNGLKART